jgi:type II secretory pathway predicted ATPase ExeA/cell division septation protein DedD
MYSNFFRFSEKPFDLTPDPKYLYLNEGYREVLASLIYGIQERRGFIAVVGEVGTGKTTLIKAVLDRLDQHTKVAHLFNTDMTFEQLLVMALVELGAAKPVEALTKPESLHRLYDFATGELAKGGNVVLVVDEAQNLDRGALESLRLLSNLETRKHKLIQIVLCGQPELEAKLNDPSLRQLAQRISIRRRIVPLSEKEVYEYIDDRLVIANYRGPSLFTDEALGLIWKYSGGVPRKINILCDNALLIAYGLGKKKIKASVIEEIVSDLGWSPHPQSVSPPAGILMNKASALPRTWFKGYRYPMAAGLGLAACVIIVLLLLPRESPFTQKRKTFLVPSYQTSAVVSDQPAMAKASFNSPPPVALDPGGVFAEKDKEASETSSTASQTNDDSKPAGTIAGAEAEKPAPASVVTRRDSDQPQNAAATAVRTSQTVEEKSSVTSVALTRKEERRIPETRTPKPRSEAGTPKIGNQAIQVGAFHQEQPARRLMGELRQKGYAPYLQEQTLEKLGLVYRVRIQGYASLSEARAAVGQLKEQGFKGAFIVRHGGH